MTPAKKANDALGFGFGVIDNWVFVYATGTLLTGIGAGMLFASMPHITLTRTTGIGGVLLVVGAVVANVAHSSLKKKAQQRSTQAATPPPGSGPDPGSGRQ